MPRGGEWGLAVPVTSGWETLVKEAKMWGSEYRIDMVKRIWVSIADLVLTFPVSDYLTLTVNLDLGPEQQNVFDGDESKYELWQVKFQGSLRIQHLHQIVLSPTDQSDDIDFVEKNATVFAELI